MSKIIYKICKSTEWANAVKSGTYHGSQDDRRDGFIHFSAYEQLSGTLAKHFAGQSDLVLIEISARRLGNKLKWEQSRGGQIFPHLYGELDVSLATKIRKIELGNDCHIIPESETLP